MTEIIRKTKSQHSVLRGKRFPELRLVDCGLGYLLLMLAASNTIALAQAKPGATGSSRNVAKTPSRIIPSIKCTDPESAVSCKSFKQLVDARDHGILFEVMGNPEDAGRHLAYVCPRRSVDVFTLVAFTMPERKKFQPFVSTDDEKLRRLFAGVWLRDDPAHPLSTSAINQWFKDHRDGIVYANAVVGFTSYQDGQLATLKIDNGEWSQSARAAHGPSDDGYEEYGGYHYWIQAYNEVYANGSLEADDPTNIHLHIDGRSIYAHYGYKNRKGDLIDYVLQIQRSTGRFTETVKVGEEADDVAGTCMIFKY